MHIDRFFFFFFSIESDPPYRKKSKILIFGSFSKNDDLLFYHPKMNSSINKLYPCDTEHMKCLKSLTIKSNESSRMNRYFKENLKTGKTENKSSIEYRNSKEISIWQLPHHQLFDHISYIFWKITQITLFKIVHDFFLQYSLPILPILFLSQRNYFFNWTICITDYNLLIYQIYSLHVPHF